MRPQSYIGITGFTTSRQVEAVINNSLPVGSKRLVMAGVLVSSRTLRGEANKWPERYPKPEQLKGIFTPHDCLLNLLHFNTKEPEKLLDDMCTAQDLAGPNCDGFQLNIAWPDKKVLEQYKTKAQFRRKVVVLQCGMKTIERFEGLSYSVERLAHQVKEYEGLIDYVLIDPSGGLGLEFDQAFAIAQLEALAEVVPNLGLGIAGGLSASNLANKLSPLLQRFKSFSIDAEGRLRDKEDHLDLTATCHYLQNADRLFGQFEEVA